MVSFASFMTLAGAAADLDGDSVLDLITSNGTRNTVSVLLNMGEPSAPTPAAALGSWALPALVVLLLALGLKTIHRVQVLPADRRDL